MGSEGAVEISQEAASLGRRVARWFRDFERSIAEQDEAGLRSLLADPSYLRDNGALTWDFHQYLGQDAVVALLLSLDEDLRPRNFSASREWPAPSLYSARDTEVVEAFYEFETANARAVLVLNGLPDASSPYGFLARSIYTRLEALNGVGAPEVHPRGSGFPRSTPGETWGEFRHRWLEFPEESPEVLVVGAGQSGLVLGAHLAKLGVETLIVDRNERVGDNWRERYESLELHNPVEMNKFPFLDFPPQYPQYLPKDLVGDWLDLYSRYIDVPIWNSTEFLGADYEEEAQLWTVRLRRR